MVETWCIPVTFQASGNIVSFISRTTINIFLQVLTFRRRLGQQREGFMFVTWLQRLDCSSRRCLLWLVKVISWFREENVSTPQKSHGTFLGLEFTMLRNVFQPQTWGWIDWMIYWQMGPRFLFPKPPRVEIGNKLQIPLCRHHLRWNLVQ